MAKPIPTRFPFINLQKSLQRAKELVDADRNHKGISVPMAFAAWGYSEKSSGGFQTVAALMSYGILEDEGANSDRRVKFTSDGKRYFATELDEDKDLLRKRFASHPPLLRHLIDEWGSRIPPDHIARTYLKTEIGLNEQSSRTVLGILKENLNYAGSIKSSIGNDAVATASEVAEPPAVGSFVQWTSGGVIQFPAPRRVRWISDDGLWLAVDQSETGIPAAEVEVVEAPQGTPAIPTPPIEKPVDNARAERALGDNEIEWLRNRVGKETTVRMLVSGEMGVREIAKLITLLEAQKLVLEDD